MWLEWIEDEKKILDSSSPDAQKYILSLFERALYDFQYCRISSQYLEFNVQLFEQRTLDLAKVRENFEKTIAVLGYDYDEGGKYWSSYLEFEQGLGPEQQDPKLLRSIFQRWLAIPQNDAAIAWSEYEDWETDAAEKERQEALYRQAEERLPQFTRYAEEFSARMKVLEQSNDIQPLIRHLGDPLLALSPQEFSYVQVYYERVLSEYLLNKTLWLKYCSYALQLCQQTDLKLQILVRALKNVQDEWQIWLMYLNLQEKTDETFDLPKMESIVD